MKRPLQQADRWLRQADHDLAVARANFTNGFYSDACFMSEQTAQKAMKAFLYAKGERTISEHSIGGMMRRALVHDSSFNDLLEQAAVLDQYYIPTRYPDVLADPAVPFESYPSEQAARALELATDILQHVKQQVGSR